MALNRYQQADKACLLAREHKLDAECEHIHWGGYRIGAKRYHNPIDFTVAIIVAFKKVGLPIPQEILERPNDID